MRLTQINNPEELLETYSEKDIVVEIKYDGWKLQIIKSDNKINIYSRKGEKKTDNFPTLTNALNFLPNNTIVEGELVYLYNGKQDVGKVTSLAGSSPKNSQEVAKNLPGELKIFLYDILWVSGKNITKESFSTRRNILEKLVKPSSRIQITKQFPFLKWQNVMKEAVDSGGEGIVLKIKDKPYHYKEIGKGEPKPKDVMYKFKGAGLGKSDSDDYVVYEYEMSDKGKLKALFGQYYQGKLYHISEISNFSKKDEEAIKSKLKRGLFVVEINFQERLPGGLRHQSFSRFREDKKPKDATMNEFHVKHIDNFELAKSNKSEDKEWEINQIYDDEQGNVYNIEKLWHLTESNPIRNMPVESLRPQLAEKSWGYSPQDVLNNPEQYAGEMEMIRDADLSYPILMYKNQIVDGNHRLAKAFFEKEKTIKVKMPTDKQMESAKVKENITGEEIKKASIFLSKRAAYADEVLSVLEKKFGPKGIVQPTTNFTGLKDVRGVDIQKAYQIISTLESGGGYTVSDSDTSFGSTQVQFGSFVSKLAAHPEAQRATGISSEEYSKLGEAWLNFSKKMRGTNIWVRVPVDEAAVKEFVRANPKAVVARKEGTTIKYSPGNLPGVVKKVGDKYLGYAIDTAKLKEMGLNVDTPYMISELKLLVGQFITDAVVRNGIVKLFVAQNNPDTYSKFQRTFSRKNVIINKDVRRVADSVAQQDFMNRVNSVINSVQKSGYDVNASGSYNIYQLIAISNAAGVGAVQNFLFRKKPFSRGQTHYLVRANKMITKVTGIASDYPPNDGMSGFGGTRVATFMFSKRASEEWSDEEKTLTVPFLTNEQLIARDIVLKELQKELNENEDLLEEIRTEYEEEFSRKIDKSELKPLLKDEVEKHIIKRWPQIPEKKATTIMLSKRAAYKDVAGTLYFPGQYAEEIKSGKRQMTIRANDVPVKIDEVVKCMTYSGSRVCDIKITSKETMSLGRIQKAFGKHIAKSLEQKFGKNCRFVVIRFELFKNINEADDLPTVPFPQEEYKGLEYKLKSGKGIYTTRISRERGKYKEGQEFITPWGHKVKVMSVVQLEGVENHPFLDELTEEQKKQIGKHKYDLVRFEKIVRNKADDEKDEGDKKWDEILIDKDDVKLTRKQIRSHYEKSDIRKKIMVRIKGKPILIYLGIGKNQKILKRNHDGKQITITNDDPEKNEDPHNYFYWTKRRLLAIHEVFETKTNLGFVDLDIHGKFEFGQAEKYARKLVGKIKEKFGSIPMLYQSGGSGIHIEFGLKREIQINDLRKELKELLDEFNKDWDDVTTGVVKGSGMRSDVSTLHNKGSLRVPWSLGETYGKVKKPLSDVQDDDDYGNDTWGRKNISDPTWPPGDALISQPTGGTTVSPTGNVGSYNMSDDGSFAMSVRDGLVKSAFSDIVEEYIWLWDGDRLYFTQSVETDALGKTSRKQVHHYDLAMRAGLENYDDDRYARGFVTFYRSKSKKPEITTYGHAFVDLSSRLQDRLERAADLVPGSYTNTIIDPTGTKIPQEVEAYKRLNMIWKIAARIDDENVEKFWEEYPELAEESETEGEEESLGFGSEEEEEATRRPIKKSPVPVVAIPVLKQPPIDKLLQKPTEKPVEMPKKPKEVRIKSTEKTFKDIVEPKSETSVKPTKPTKTKKVLVRDQLIDEILDNIASKTKMPSKTEVSPKTEKSKKDFSIPKSDEEDIVSQMLAGEDEDIGKDLLEKPVEHLRPSAFGKVEPLADDKGNVLVRWPIITTIPKMSEEARLYFTPEALSEGPSLRKLFMNPKAWELLRNEKQLIQSWILPAIVMTIGAKWFKINSGRNYAGKKRSKYGKTVEDTPFRMFDENDAEAIKRGMLVEDLPKTQKYVQDINRILAKILEEYFAKGFNMEPIDACCYKTLGREMTKIVAEDNDHKEVRYPVCAICKAQKSKNADISKMKRTTVEKNLWTCLECQKRAEQLESVDLSDVKAKILKLNDEIDKIKHQIMQSGVSLEDVETEQEKQRVSEKIETSKKKYEALKLVMLNMKEKENDISNEINKLRAQRNVPYMHTWCPNDSCPGQRVPLTSIDWNNSFWKTPAGIEAQTALMEKMEIMPPGEYKSEQKASDLSENDQKRGQKPPQWMLDVPFICPHDNVHFTLRDAVGKGYEQRGGLFWKPYQRSEWIPKGERSVPQEAMENIGTDNDVEEKIAYQQLGKLARNIFLKKYWDVYNLTNEYISTEIEKNRPIDRIVHDQGYISLQRRLILYDVVRDFSAIDSELFVGWLAGREFGKKFVKDDDGKIKNKPIIKNKSSKNKSLLPTKREEIYLPLLQQWVDKMLLERGGYEKYHLDDWVTDSEMDGIPHFSDGGAYFVSKIEEKTIDAEEAGPVFNGFECGLKPKMRGGKPLRGKSESNVKLLRVLGVWKLTSADLVLLGDINSKLPGILDGTTAIQNSETVRKLLKGKSNRISEIYGHDFHRASLNAEGSMFAPDEYVLVKALIMPSKYYWAPIEHIKNLRKDSDDDDMFYQFGMEAAGHNDDPTYWSQLNNMLKGLKNPEEMKAVIEGQILHHGVDTQEEMSPVITVIEEDLDREYNEYKKNKPKREKKTEKVIEVVMEDLDKEYNEYLKTLSKPPKSDARDTLSSYKKKREFDETSEPEGKVEKKNKHRFVIQNHLADRAGQHWDLRLENDEGAMSSWAVPKHKLPDGKTKLLAVKTEDHPISYMRFEGEIPTGEYGSGKVEVYDSGTYEEIEWGKSKIMFRLKGKKEKKTYNLIHTDGNRWLLMVAKEDE